MLRNLLLSITLLATIELNAQTPPMPVVPVMMNAWATNDIAPVRRTRLKTYTANCPHCQTIYANLHPLNIVTNGSVATNGGSIVQRTMTFGCPNRDCRERFDSRNTVFSPESIAVEDTISTAPIVGGGASTVLPDTNAPVVTNVFIRQASILDFTNQVPVSFRINNGHFYWLDALTGQQVTKALDLEFQTHSNYFYTVWLCSPLSPHGSNWIEYPSDKQLHPARGDFLAGLSVPLYDTNRFYCIRSFTGGNRVTWQ